jgi:hypothetical protein
MFSFFKKKPESVNMPAWASFFTDKEYAAFKVGIDKYFKRLKIDYDIYDDGTIRTNDKSFGLGTLGLLNVAQVCKQNGINEYIEIIREHFDLLIKADKFSKGFDFIKNDFEKVKEYLGVRLYHEDYALSVGKNNVVGINLAGDVFAMLVLDLPDSILSIKPEQVEKWDKNFDELFDLGVKNIMTNYPLSLTEEEIDNFKIWFAQGDHFFSPNIVFDLESRKELLGTCGSLIGIPHRHAAIIYPIENLETVKVINQLIPLIHGMNKQGPGSLSDNLFWCKDGKLINLPYNIEDNKLQFYPPELFIEMLNKLE